MHRQLTRRGAIVAAATFVATCLTATLPAAGPAQAATVPAGFADAKVADFDQPTTVEWLPNGRIVVLEKGGRMLVGTPGERFTERLRLNVCTESERGLLGVAADPAFLSNGWLYLYYTRPAPGAPGGCVNRLSRFTMPGDGPADRGSEVVLLDNISSRAGNHNGGAVEIGGDGYLYVGVGDAGQDPRQRPGRNEASQDLSLLNGKVLRITTSGAPAPGNPLLGRPGVTPCATRGNTPSTPTTPCAEVYSWGLRNPWRLAFDRNAPGGTKFYVNDVGQGTYEEVDQGGPGDFGWPAREGGCPQGETTPCAGPEAGQIDPVTSYGRGHGSYVTGGAFVPDGVWPSEYTGNYLFGDGGSGRIWALAGNGSVDYDAPFATGAHGLTDMVFGYDADGRATLYYTTHGGELRAITPSTSPTLPSGTPSTFVANPPYRAYDTTDEGGGHPRLAAGTSRLVDTRLPDGASAALVNLTIADTVGSGYLKAWVPGGVRPATSSVNADAGSIVANAAIVPLDADGRFIVETSVAARVIVDVMGAFMPTSGAAPSGRFVPLSSVRLADTREPAGPANQYTNAGNTWVVDTARGGFPAGDGVTAYVLSVAAIIDPTAPAGWVAAYPGGGEYTGTSNVNVTAGEIRANMIVVPADATGKVDLRRLNVADVVVDVLGYFTGPGSPSSAAGRFTFVTPNRVVDTRTDTPFDRLTGGETSSMVLFPPTPSAAVVHNVTVTATAAAGWLSAHPGNQYVPGVSSLNYTGAGQTRAVLAFTQIGANDRVGFTSKADTDLVVDVIGLFSS
ncbi:MAG TPA: PQQ-dependent sugar dehydrogenase [Ilumatobacter sp.]|nr:PQQ-dependent sugar dehydrogenase [Ilumatobacter sp.]